jgi:predicted RNase H-like HicB family nuclease
MNKELWQKAEEIANKDYAIIVTEEKASSGQSIFLAKTPELYGCMAQGLSIEDAKANLKDARIDYIYSLLKDDLKIPEPMRIVFSTIETSCSQEKNEFILSETISFEQKVHDSKPLYAVSIKC